MSRRPDAVEQIRGRLEAYGRALRLLDEAYDHADEATLDRLDDHAAQARSLVVLSLRGMPGREFEHDGLVYFLSQSGSLRTRSAQPLRKSR